MDEEFESRNREMIAAMGSDERFHHLSQAWFERAARLEYPYHFRWLGLPIIQYPQDIVALQEIMWEAKPDVVVETGIARGGSLILSASMLQLIGGEHRRVIGVDIDIRAHNRVEIEGHPLFARIEMIEGSSTNPEVVARIRGLVQPGERVLVILDSNHTHEHVLRELNLYSPLVKRGSYVVVFDTIIELMPDDFSRDRPWGREDNPYTAVREFLKSTDRFEVDETLDRKLALTAAPGSYLRCVR
jgi:cephalosporin hydroxylase